MFKKIMKYVVVLVSGVLLILTAPPSLARTGEPPWPSVSPARREAFSFGAKSDISGGRSAALNDEIPLGEPGTAYSYSGTLGTSGEPYLIDTEHLNMPGGLFVDSSDRLYVVTERGYRLLRYDPAGNVDLTLGEPGKPWADKGLLSWPEDVAVDSSGNIWVVMSNALEVFKADGTPLFMFPGDQPWIAGSDNNHFSQPFGVAIDSKGRLFVGDSQNHRVQVYRLQGENQPQYLYTLGVTGEPRSDNTGFRTPTRLAFDSQGRLYVMDTGNYRVQRCVEEQPDNWVCSTFFGETGVWGNDLRHLSYARGIAISPDAVYLCDNGNRRVLKCNFDGACELFAGGTGDSSMGSRFVWPDDVAVDSEGNVYVSDHNGFSVSKFDSEGNYVATYGTPGVPYITDAHHFNSPWGVTLDGDGNLYVSESLGARVLKFDSSGSLLWSVGEPGVAGSDNAHLGREWFGRNLAVDAQGRVFVPDASNQRIQVFSSDGDYLTTIGGRWGSGEYEFKDPTSVAVNPLNGDVLVVDQGNSRIQVFSSDLIYKATIGVTGEPGSDNAHFDLPWDVAVDRRGNVYVADGNNNRVQKCTLRGSAYECSTFVGGGVVDRAFNHLHPLGVAVDANGNVFVVDDWNNRVLVYDSTGAFLTVIGGAWGDSTGGMRNPVSVAVSSDGTLYVADRGNHRVQEFTPGFPGWSQGNINGFGDPSNKIATLASFGGALYAGTFAPREYGAELWRAFDGRHWAPVVSDGFGGRHNVAIDHLLEYRGYLYAATWNENLENGSSDGGEVWRSSNGVDWEPVVQGGFGDPSNGEVYSLAAFNGYIYGATWARPHGTEIWRSVTGDRGSWERVVENGFGNPNNAAVLAMTEFDGYLYASTFNPTDGADIWRSSDGVRWEPVVEGMEGGAVRDICTLLPYKGYLYAGGGYFHGNSWSGALFRCAASTGCDEPSDWEAVTTDGFGDPSSRNVAGLTTFNGGMYAIVEDIVSGMGIWRSFDGSHWEKVGSNGFGDSNNGRTYWGKAFVPFGTHLYVGTFNFVQGGEIWYDTQSSFSDVSRSHWSWPYVERLYAAGITGGCATNPLRYCPDAPVTRGQMAVFLEKGLHYPDSYTPPDREPTFPDTAGHWAEDWIEALKADGLTSGYPDGTYRPDRSVTRAEMAVFLLKAKHGANYQPPAVDHSRFSDVGDGYWAKAWIEELAAEGITAGYPDGTYRPDNAVTRAEMSVFLVKTFDLP